MFLLWNKLLSFHLVVNFADCDIFENTSYIAYLIEIGMQDKLTKAWTIINKNPHVDLLIEQHLPKKNWQPFNLLLLLWGNFLEVDFFFLNEWMFIDFPDDITNPRKQDVYFAHNRKCKQKYEHQYMLTSSMVTQHSPSKKQVLLLSICTSILNHL